MGLKQRINEDLCGLPVGERNSITDVPGIRIGHKTLRGHGRMTGVTAMVPGSQIFAKKFPAAAYVSNGFGKSMGLIQIQEMGYLETPIVLSNTFAEGACYEALVRYSLERNPTIGVETGTVNPVVLECNDGEMNTIRDLAVSQEDVFSAIADATPECVEGDVGAGTGMVCFGMKGGIGTSSRVLNIDGRAGTIGVLVLSNFGDQQCFRLAGQVVHDDLSGTNQHQMRHGIPSDIDIPGVDKGSIVSVLATDLPMDSRQLHRLAKRVTVGIARTGGYVGNGSGEIVVAFSTSNRIHHRMDAAVETIERLHEDAMDVCFRATAAASEEAIISSLMHAHTRIGRSGTIHSLRDVLNTSANLPAGK
ncbi:MAG: P1 family peptidase [Bifidobacterium sp.]|jgi:D-aminopeptidase|nr:P1 family peptidase [Bifidobacterium sp.]MCH4174586.1 P1 family peptidase [Bifidobacterium sp.]